MECFYNTRDIDSYDYGSGVDGSSSDWCDFVDISSNVIKKMKVSKLGDELKMLGFLLRGDNTNLVSWIHQAMVYRVILVETTKKTNTVASETSMVDFTIESY